MITYFGMLEETHAPPLARAALAPGEDNRV